MRAGEQEDLEKAKAEVQKLKIDAMDMLTEFEYMPVDTIRAAGHPSYVAAIQWTISDCSKKVQKVWAAHLKKYPD